jgi:hypothetical protein
MNIEKGMKLKKGMNLEKDIVIHERRKIHITRTSSGGPKLRIVRSEKTEHYFHISPI